jgi:hypothetical protein
VLGVDARLCRTPTALPTSRPRRSPRTAPAFGPEGRCRSARWRACSARPRAAGHAAASPKPGTARYLPSGATPGNTKHRVASAGVQNSSATSGWRSQRLGRLIPQQRLDRWLVADAVEQRPGLQVAEADLAVPAPCSARWPSSSALAAPSCAACRVPRATVPVVPPSVMRTGTSKRPSHGARNLP